MKLGQSFKTGVMVVEYVVIWLKHINFHSSVFVFIILALNYGDVYVDYKWGKIYMEKKDTDTSG